MKMYGVFDAFYGDFIKSFEDKKSAVEYIENQISKDESGFILGKFTSGDEKMFRLY